MISVIVGGIEYDLNTLASVVGHDGWGMSPMHRLSTRGSQQHGETDHGHRLDARIGRLILQPRDSTLAGMYATRQALMRLFAPANNPILRFTLPAHTRQFDVVYAGDLMMPWEADDWAAQRILVSLKAGDPTCYDPAGCAVTFALGGGAASGTVPRLIPRIVGTFTLNQTEAVAYGGSADSSPDLIRITGPIVDPILTHDTTGNKLDFTGITIAAGDYYDIDPRFDRKTVKNAAGVSKISDLTSDSDLSTFRFVAPVDGSDSRINQFRMTGGAVSAATKVEINYYERFLGV